MSFFCKKCGGKLEILFIQLLIVGLLTGLLAIAGVEAYNCYTAEKQKAFYRGYKEGYEASIRHETLVKGVMDESMEVLGRSYGLLRVK